MVNQLLTEMDGLETRQQVFILAATNRPGRLGVRAAAASSAFKTGTGTHVLGKEG